MRRTGRRRPGELHALPGSGRRTGRLTGEVGQRFDTATDQPSFATVTVGLVGVVAKGLLYLLFVGIAVLIVALALSAVRFRRGGRSANR